MTRQYPYPFKQQTTSFSVASGVRRTLEISAQICSASLCIASEILDLVSVDRLGAALNSVGTAVAETLAFNLHDHFRAESTQVLVRVRTQRRQILPSERGNARHL